MPDLGKALVILGAAIACVGALIWSGLGRPWFGRLPGDLHARWGNTEVYLPPGTCLLVSAVLTLVPWLLRGRRLGGPAPAAYSLSARLTVCSMMCAV